MWQGNEKMRLLWDIWPLINNGFVLGGCFKKGVEPEPGSSPYFRANLVLDSARAVQILQNVCSELSEKVRAHWETSRELGKVCVFQCWQSRDGCLQKESKGAPLACVLNRDPDPEGT